MTNEPLNEVDERPAFDDGTDRELGDLARKLASVKRWREELADKDRDASAEERMIKGRLRELMERREMTRFHVSGVGLVYSQNLYFPKVVGDPAAVTAWLDAEGATDVAPRTIKVDRLRELLQEREENDRPLPPPDLVEVQRGREVRFRADAAQAEG